MHASFDRFACWGLGCALLLACSPAERGPGSGPQNPAAELELEVGLEAGGIPGLHELLERAVAAGEVPGGVCLVGRGAEQLEFEAFGRRASGREDQTGQPPQGEQERFDLASLTKPVATATAIAILVDRGALDLDRPLALDWPEFATGGKAAITPRQLLLHRAGLVPDNALDDWRQGPEELWRRMAALEVRSPPGTAFAYSDVGYAILAHWVERVAGEAFETFVAREVFRPLGMDSTGFNPGPGERPLCVPTEPAFVEEQRAAEGLEAPLQGVVHDPRARAIGGVAGHAGLFSTAADLARWCRLWLGLGPQLFGERTRREFLRASWLPDQSGGRALLADVDTPYAGPRGAAGPVPGFWRGASLGHTGFTGTSFWMDPEDQAYAILLTSPLGAGEGASALGLRRRFGSLVGSELREGWRREHSAPLDTGMQRVLPGVRVWTGAEVLVRLEPERFSSQRIALVTHDAGRLADGRRTLDALRALPGLELDSIWTPEHGLSSRTEGAVGDGVDAESGVPLRSLYGDTRRPLPEWFSGLDAVLFDCQDVGVRFYTYATTLAYLMEAAGQAGVPVWVLDRPNPLGLERVGGPLLEAARRSFIGYAPIPVQHGLTLGELARTFVERLGLACELHVIPCRGLERSLTWPDFGLSFVPPSPNLRSPEAVALYPLLGCFEACALSVGRGTERPFECLGAPWLDGERLAAALAAHPIPGLAVEPIRFSPQASVFAGQSCGGLAFWVVSERFDPLPASFALAQRLLETHPTSFDPGPLIERWGAAAWLEALRSPESGGSPLPSAEPALEFQRQQRPLWLYPGD